MQPREGVLALLALFFALSLAWVFFVVAAGDVTMESPVEGILWVFVLFVLPAGSAFLWLSRDERAPWLSLFSGTVFFVVSIVPFSYRLQSFGELVIASIGTILSIAIIFFSLQAIPANEAPK